jgi:hypothetical protein
MSLQTVKLIVWKDEPNDEVKQLEEELKQCPKIEEDDIDITSCCIYV